MEADRHIDAGDGTTEATWLSWPALHELPEFETEMDSSRPPRIVVVAPHPDDEVLSVGGLLARVSQSINRAQRVVVVSVTDGEASHPDSPDWPRDRLKHARERETLEALQRLGRLDAPLRLHLPDGGVAAKEQALVDRLVPLLGPEDWIFTTWRFDGHPDHEATARACAKAVQTSGGRLVEVPVWAWHWSVPGDARVPWHRASRLSLAADEIARKNHAVQAFHSQLRPDLSTGASAILRSTTVARAARPFEIYFA